MGLDGVSVRIPHPFMANAVKVSSRGLRKAVLVGSGLRHSRAASANVLTGFFFEGRKSRKPIEALQS